MSLLPRLLGSLFSAPDDSRAARRAAQPTMRRWQPRLELLEARTLLSCSSLIQSNFDGTPIAAGTSIWFNGALKISGLHSSPVTLRLLNSTIDSASFHLHVPNAAIIFSPTATLATTAFDAPTNTWVTTAPFQFSGNLFLAGVTLPVTSNLPGGINPVSWQGQFESDTSGISINWQWGAAVYTRFSTDYNALGVKPVDDNHLDVYLNSDHAGTPENFRAFVTSGARGGGGSNFTGSYSGTASVQPCLFVPASLSGLVTNETTHAGIANVLVTLTGTNDLGLTITITTTTTASGSYSFTGLRAGTYAITETLPAGFSAGHDTVGSAGGTASGNRITGIALNAGVNAGNYNFGNLFSGSGGGIGGS